jgi:phosphoadenosine phosphosulfate reductase
LNRGQGNDKINDIMINEQLDLFQKDKVSVAIERLHKFESIAKQEGLKVICSFSGGKDSIVILDLCKKSGINFEAKFFQAFESPEVLRFIKKEYSEVEFVSHHYSFYQAFRDRKIFPTKRMRWCCSLYKEGKTKNDATILGVRRAESIGRRDRKVISIRLKKDRTGDKMKVFESHCYSEKANSRLELKPIVDWTDKDVWDYIKENNLHYPQLYNEGVKRCGCMFCPLTNIEHNAYYIRKYPKQFLQIVKIAKDVYTPKTEYKVPYTTDYNIIVYCLHWLNYSWKAKTTKKEEQLIKDLADWLITLF